MNVRFWIGVALCGAWLVAGSTAADDRVASVLGEDIMRAQLAPDDGRGQARRFAALIWPRIARDYIEGNGLLAMPDEVAELGAYEAAFEKKDRAQRARKLAELDQRLASNTLEADARAHAEDFRNTLRRLQQHDAEADALPKPDAAQRDTTYGPWIEMWKMNRALQKQYGGVVALTPFGPDPQGARAALFADYEQQGKLRFFDALLRGRFYEMLAEKPRSVVNPGEVDFTPYWRRPIPSSYFSE